MPATQFDRRAFLTGVAATCSAAALAASSAYAGMARQKPGGRRAYMLGGLRAGDVEATFRKLKEAGFDGVELISPTTVPTSEIVAARDATGLVVHGVSGGEHWRSPLSDPDSKVVAKGVAAIRQEIEDCKAYGGTTVLIVPAIVTPKVSYQQAWDRSTAALKDLVPVAEKAGIVLAIEEVWNRFLLSSVEMARYVDSFQSDFVKTYFDVGNVVEYGWPQEWIRTLGPRIAKIHIKEYAKPKRFDYLLGEGGEINWDEVRQALKDIHYTGWITAEVPLKDPADIVARMNRLLGLG
jgi:hexulose-6-phosphate isomerase